VLDAVPLAVVLTDLDDRIRTVNREAVRLLNISPSAAKITDVPVIQRLPGLAAAMVAARSAGGTQRIADITLGTERLDLTIVPLAENDRWGGIALTFERCTGQREPTGSGPAENVFRFLAMLAHELRNPLGPVVSALHVLRQRIGDDASLHRLVSIADRQLRHQARLIDDLLEVSRVVHDKVVIKVEAVKLDALVRQAVDAHAFAARSRAHRVDTLLPDEPVVVGGDSMRLEQVVRNLLANAVKFTPPGGRITVTVAREADSAVVTVSDTGIGISADMLPRVFDLFVQGDVSLARAQGGLGIGLTLVRRLVELHGGSVHASSAGANEGSTFEVRLPCATEGAVSAAPASGRQPVRPLRIVLIEDNADARQALGRLLELDGHNVRVASNGPTGVRTATETAPDVVLVDIGLPGMDGYEVARRLRRRLGSSVRLVALTGYGDTDARRRSAEAGFDGHLVKPVFPENLARALASA
jgi:signal transduction histidine kinase